MMNEKNSDYYKQEAQLNLYAEALDDPDNTKMILNKEKTRYTAGANEIIEKVQNEFLERKRHEEIDLALKTKNKKRFMELTSENWQDVL